MPRLPDNLAGSHQQLHIRNALVQFQGPFKTTKSGQFGFFIDQDLTLPPDYELGSPPGVMAEEVHLLWDLVAQRLPLASLHHSLAPMTDMKGKRIV